MKYHYTLLLFLFLNVTLFAQTTGTIEGRIVQEEAGDYIFNIQVENTLLGATTTPEGVFRLERVPAGSQQLIISGLGYRTVYRPVEVTGDQTLTLEVQVQPDVLQLDQVVVSASRTAVDRRSAPVLVSVLNEETFDATQSVCLAEGLNFQPGLRVETDCQTCNYTQLRINGLGGGYSQILIDSRPLLSGLGGLYGLEQIPANMIERVEVVRGGGSALYGSSAIGGTVNVITRTPERSGYAVTLNQGLIDGQAFDHSLQANVSVVSEEEQRSGLSLYAARRRRGEYDANGDGFSELSRLAGQSFGAAGFWRPGDRTRLRLSVNHLSEERDGGDLLDQPPHQRTQAEQRSSHLLAANMDLETELSERSQLSFFGGAQRIRRTHYTGLYGADGYGTTDNYTVQGGVQLTHEARDFWLGANTFTAGVEYQLDDVLDEIPAYAYRIEQLASQWGAFLQSDWRLAAPLTLSVGGRLTRHNLVDRPVLTPRLSLLYRPLPDGRLRVSYARGFRAPQAFDADLHIAFAGGGIATVRINPALRPEFSDSYTASFDFDRPGERSIYGFTVAAFYTRLYDAFVLEEADADAQGNIILEKRNGGASAVAGLTLEGRANWDNLVEVQAGITLQRSQYDQPVAWSAELSGSRDYLRTPNRYGFLTCTFLNEEPFFFSLSGVYTGAMQVPHFGGAPGVPEDRVVTSPEFLELNTKLNYRFRLRGLKQELIAFAGVQNLTHAYQNDFDTGPDRDSNYIYGPARPRTFFVGLTLKAE